MYSFLEFIHELMSLLLSIYFFALGHGFAYLLSQVHSHKKESQVEQ